jgi:hypothetical protein
MLCQELWKRWTGAVHLPSLGLLSAYMSLKKTNEENRPSVRWLFYVKTLTCSVQLTRVSMQLLLIVVVVIVHLLPSMKS